MVGPSVRNLSTGAAVAIARHFRKSPSGQVMARPAKEEGLPRQQLGLKFGARVWGGGGGLGRIGRLRGSGRSQVELVRRQGGELFTDGIDGNFVIASAPTIFSGKSVGRNSGGREGGSNGGGRV